MTPTQVTILGCGWLGLPLGRALVAAGHVVHGTTRSADRFPELTAAGILPFQVRLTPDWEGAPPARVLDAAILVIALPPGRRQPGGGVDYPARMDAIARAMRGTPVDRVLMVSSTSVYPDLNRVVVEEDAGQGELEGSGAVVWEAEQRVRAFPGVRVTVVRMAGLYGYDRQPGRTLAGKPLVPNGRAPVNLIHQDDAVGILMAVMKGDVWGEVFNACAEAHPERAVMYTEQAKRLGLPAPAFDLSPNPSFKIVSSSRLQAVLGYTFRHPDPMAPAP